VQGGTTGGTTARTAQLRSGRAGVQLEVTERQLRVAIETLNRLLPNDSKRSDPSLVAGIDNALATHLPQSPSAEATLRSDLRSPRIAADRRMLLPTSRMH